MARFVQSKDVAWNFLGETIVAFNIAGEREFHSMNAPAAFVFSKLEVPQETSKLVAALVEEFDVEPAVAESDVGELLQVLQEKRLIIEA